MSTYIVGDVHGCYNELLMLLKKVNFNSSTDEIWFTGDVIFKGPNSFEVLTYIRSLDKKCRLILGNHELKLLMIFDSLNKDERNEFLKKHFFKFESKKRHFYNLLLWLKKQKMLYVDHRKKIIISHAGIPPQWDIDDVDYFCKELQKIVFEKNFQHLKNIFLNKKFVLKWSRKLELSSKINFCINALTCMRYCKIDGSLDMTFKCHPSYLPKKHNLTPWFYFPSKMYNYTIIFGHWSTIGLIKKGNFIGLDTGCCYGKYLTMVNINSYRFFKQKSLVSDDYLIRSNTSNLYL